MNAVTQNVESDFGLDKKAVSKMREVFAGVPAVEQVIIYGSRAKGDHRPPEYRV